MNFAQRVITASIRRLCGMILLKKLCVFRDELKALVKMMPRGWEWTVVLVFVVRIGHGVEAAA